MGYPVPENKKQSEYALNEELKKLFAGNPDRIYLMNALFEAYSVTDNEFFNQNQNKFYKDLSDAFREFELVQQNNGLFPDKDTVIFPENERSMAHFKDTFRKLWRSISMAYELNQRKDEEKKEFELDSHTNDREVSVAEIYNNYSDVYDQILIEKDMIFGLARGGRFTKSDYPKYLQPALRDLNLLAMGRKDEDAFNAEDLQYIKARTELFNRAFKPNTNDPDKRKLPGIFVGDEIKTVGDLRKYVERYEMMFRDYLKFEAEGHVESFYDFAQQYEQRGDTVEKLTENDLKDMNSRIDIMSVGMLDKELDKRYQALLKEYQDLLDEKNWKHAIENIYAQNENAVNNAIQDGKKQLKNDADIKNKENERIQEDNATFNHGDKEFKRIHNANLRLAYAQQHEQRELNKLLDDYKRGTYGVGDVADPAENFDQKRRDVLHTFASEKKNIFETEQKEQFTTLSAGKTSIQSQLTELNDELKKLKKNPAKASLAVQNSLLEKADKLAAALNTNIQSIKKTQSTLNDNLKTVAQTSIDTIKKVDAAEKKDHIARLDQAIESEKNFRKKFDQDYQNSAYAKRCAKEGILINTMLSTQDQLQDICDTLDGVKKKTLFGKEKDNSKEYNDMVAAVRAYTNGTGGKYPAQAAHKACQDYLNLHKDTDGKLTHMESEVGRVRKQACVRMMEILENSYDFRYESNQMRNNAEAGRAKKPVGKKTDFKSLKQELAKKAKDHKAYNDLQDKLNITKAEKEKKAQEKKAAEMKAQALKKAPANAPAK